ncbi:MAG TPA: hypothetical protein VLH35_00945 [Candidatus Acidoferrales bacterium]|nr:hypothetical protein [Candidatus Acidoferrales bacterium]
MTTKRQAAKTILAFCSGSELIGITIQAITLRSHPDTTLLHSIPAKLRKRKNKVH